MATPTVANLTDDNGDGVIDSNDIPDIIVVTYGGYGTLRAVKGDTGDEIFNVVGYPLQGQGQVSMRASKAGNSMARYKPPPQQLHAQSSPSHQSRQVLYHHRFYQWLQRAK